jgi:hypothetical protein
MLPANDDGVFPLTEAGAEGETATTTLVPEEAGSAMALSGAFDPAVLYGFATRIWTIAAGLVNLLLIARFFSPAVQGFYYTFASLLGWTAFLELGLATVIQQFASHEWAHLSLGANGEIAGDSHAAERLAALARIAFRWYSIASLASTVVIGVGGAIFLSRHPAAGVSWILPWVALVLTSGVALFLLPGWMLLDGCNQLERTNRTRLFLVVGSSLATWATILFGGELWTSSASTIVNLVITIVFFRASYSAFFRSLRRTPTHGANLNWRHELWPMQWRIALSWMCGYFIFSLMTPVLFSVRGAVVAGQMGMTMTLFNSLLAVSLTWALRRAPMFGILIARREYQKLDVLYRHTLLMTLGLAVLGSAVIYGVLVGLRRIHHPLGNRFLEPGTAGVMLIATVITIGVGVMATYLRAHKREPFMVPSLLNGLVVGIGMLVFGKRFGVAGISAVYLASVAFFAVVEVVIFFRCRARWHAS